MKKSIAVLVISFIAFTSCKTETGTKNKVEKAATPTLTVVDSIAMQHGFDSWKDIAQFNFTFNVDRNDSHYERSWSWNTTENTVVATEGEDVFVYNRGSLDSIANIKNANFINDRYWILLPFNLIWDRDNYTYSQTKNTIAPISNVKMNQLTIVYSNEGGYTPGDAYDIYFDDDYTIKEWVFRKGNQTEPSMTTTWEEYVNIEGMQLGTMHRDANKTLALYLSNITAKRKQ